MQNYANHARFDTLYHKILFPVLVLTLIGAGVNFAKSIGDHERFYSASLILVLTVCLVLVMLYARVYPLKAQDRAIHAEENLRHFVLTGKLLDSRIEIRQVIALRFAPDEEFAPLARRAAEESLTPDAIKQAVKNWRADNYRV